MDAYLVARIDYDIIQMDSVWTSRADAELRLEEVRAKAERYEQNWEIEALPLDRAGFR